MVGRRVTKALDVAFVRSAREPGKYFDGHGVFLRADAQGGVAQLLSEGLA